MRYGRREARVYLIHGRWENKRLHEIGNWEARVYLIHGRWENKRLHEIGKKRDKSLFDTRVYLIQEGRQRRREARAHLINGRWESKWY